MRPSTLTKARLHLRRLIRNDQLILSVLAVFVGSAAAAGAVAFREAIDGVQFLSFGFVGELVATMANELPAWRIILAPTVGGLLVGLFVYFVMPGRRPQGVADVVEVSALRAGRMSFRQGLGAFAVSAASIGSGASVGREGPAVHFGAALASFVSRPLHLSRAQSRTLLGCGVAAAVSASFNAPIAGAFFALEVIIGHYALPAFAPIVVAAVTGTVISRAYFGDFPAFIVAPKELVSFLEFPAFVVLGIVCALVSVVFIRSIFAVEDMWKELPIPPWIRPAIAGALVGALAVMFPEVLGVGYEAMVNALNETYELHFLLALIVVKIAATAICMGSGFGGGIFSPSLFLGAVVGGAFGIIATIPFPEFSSGHGAYTLIGMGAVAGAVLGAPISTILIIFELTGDYRMTIAVMISVVIASILTRHFQGVSFFSCQLKRRGLELEGGHESGVLEDIRVAKFVKQDFVAVSQDAPIDDVRHLMRTAPHGELFVVGEGGALVGTIVLHDLGEDAFDHRRDDELTAKDVMHKSPPAAHGGDDVQTAIRIFQDVDEGILPIVDDGPRRVLIGCIHEREVMRAYNHALLNLRAEEHGHS